MLLSLLLAAQAANVPALPDDIPQDAARYSVLIMGKPAGQQAVWTLPDGKLRTFFQFNDRGRGPKTYSTATLKDGLVISEEVTGNDYMKDPVTESFSIKDGTASWKSKAESGQKKLDGPAVYLPLFGPPNDSVLLVKALFAHGGKLPLLPDGEARIEKVLSRGKLSLYGLAGLDFEPDYLWLDDKNDFFAYVSTWNTIIREGQEGRGKELLDAQDGARKQRSRAQAQRLAHRPKGKLLIHGVSVFDAESATLQPHHDVLIEGNRIVAVTPSQDVPSGAEVIDGDGKTLIPGLWDMHAHVGPTDGLLNLAAGVTSVRDLANDIDELNARHKRIEAGEEIGTRIVMAGFIDGPGPYQGPTKVLVSTEKEARDWVAKYAALGYLQIKLYSSLNPELVPAIADEAHRRGLRLSGHVPAFMTASEAVRDGYDEIQHLNMLLLNFMPEVKDTRTPARFLEPAKRAADLDLKSQPVRDFIALLKDRHVALDLTLSVFESMMLDRAGVVDVALAKVARRLPVQVARGLYAGKLPVPEGMDARYQASWKKSLELVHELWAAGIPIEAGTDAMAGFALHRELELDAQAGIPPAQVLQLATYGAARLMGKNRDLGLIRPGMLADVVLIDGDPTRDISDVRKTALTIKDGVVYRPDELHRELGVAPR